MDACLKGHTEIVKLLLEYQANINIQNNNGSNALMFACYKAHIEIVKLLLEYQADIFIEDKDEHSAITYASAANNNKIAQILRKHEFDIPLSSKLWIYIIAFFKGLVKGVLLPIKRKIKLFKLLYYYVHKCICFFI